MSEKQSQHTPGPLKALRHYSIVWDRHKYDPIPDGDGGEFIVYSEDPEMVKQARAAIAKARREG